MDKTNASSAFNCAQGSFPAHMWSADKEAPLDGDPIMIFLNAPAHLKMVKNRGDWRRIPKFSSRFQTPARFK